MFKSRIHIMLIIALLLASVASVSAQTVPPKSDEGKLIAVLSSDNASHKDKVDACRGLALIATSKSIAPLAKLLGDDKLSHMARYALEPIQDPSVDAALRDALGKLKGRPLVGVIGSLGVRRDAQAVQPLLQILMQNQAGPEAMSATMRALGQIGTVAAAEVLKISLDHAPTEGLLDVYEGLFRCAETLAAKGNRSLAINIYDTLRAQDAAHQVRAGALRGAILARGIKEDIPRRAGETTRQYLQRRNDGVSLLAEYVQSDDYIMFSAAAQTALEMPGTEVTQALYSGLNKLPADNQILVLWTLGKRGDATALPAVFALARSGSKAVRMEAIRVMPQFQDGAAVSELVKLMNDSDKEITKAAQDSLAAIPGRRADSAVVAMLKSSQTSKRLTALELMGRRRMTESVPALLKVASDADAEVRPAALRKVGELGSPAQVPALLDLLMRLENSRDLSAAERSLITVCGKSDDAKSYTGRLAGQLGRAGTAQKNALLRVLGAVGGSQALEAVRKAAKDSDAKVRDAAIRVLCGWKTADAAPDLLTLAKASGGAHKTAALRGYINLIRDESLSTARKLAMAKQADALIERNQEKKLLLGALATVPSAEALSMAMANLGDPATKNEACFAAVAIGKNIVEQHPREVTEALQKVLEATNNRNVTRSAQDTLGKARRR
ncbi:MAG: HEAT repeat domain-containing protein [Planctomycetota bacterium]|nr:HEAT repeat domain-containing protein [Planctomycetota bacterium]